MYIYLSSLTHTLTGRISSESCVQRLLNAENVVNAVIISGLAL